MRHLYRLIAAVLTRTPHIESVHLLRRPLDPLRSWGWDAHAMASSGMRRNVHPRTGAPVVFYRHWGQPPCNLRCEDRHAA